MRYQGKIYRPPSEADAWILQATLGCSWNHCVYCDMYREKKFSVRDVDELKDEIQEVCNAFSKDGMLSSIKKVFIADGDALVMKTEELLQVLHALKQAFPHLKRISCYATAQNLLEKSQDELNALSAAGLTRLYIGPESGDDVTLKKLAKGASFAEHVEAAQKARGAKMEMSVIVLLGAGGTKRSVEHAHATAKLMTEMDPEFFSALTLTVVKNTPLYTLQKRGQFELPPVDGFLKELRILVDEARPKRALFRTNHASNYLPIGGILPQDREKILHVIDEALSGRMRLRSEHSRGL